MTRAQTYVLAAGLTALSVAAMAWSAERPGDGIGSTTRAHAEDALSDIAGWFRPGPIDGRPDWADAAQTVQGADADRGAALLVLHGCGACHDIPGVAGANGSVGPPLGGFASRAYVAGVLPNEPGGLVRWIVDPPRHAPQTAMPDLGVTEAEARDMAAYLYTLKGGR